MLIRAYDVCMPSDLFCETGFGLAADPVIIAQYVCCSWDICNKHIYAHGATYTLGHIFQDVIICLLRQHFDGFTNAISGRHSTL